MKKNIIVIVMLLVSSISVFSQVRAFDEIFPYLDSETRERIFSEEGYILAGRLHSDFVLLGGNDSNLDPQIISPVFARNPRFVAEAISVIPVDTNLLNVYNALGNIRDLAGRLFHSHRRDRYIPLFEEATRITSQRQTSAIPDPPPAETLPESETVFLRLRDANFGNTFYRGEMRLIQNGLSFTLSNFRNITYLLVPVIRENRFVAMLYFEPIQEGLLIYSLAGVDISDFFASQIGVRSAISKRLEVILEWAVDGITR